MSPHLKPQLPDRDLPDLFAELLTSRSVDPTVVHDICQHAAGGALDFDSPLVFFLVGQSRGSRAHAAGGLPAEVVYRVFAACPTIPERYFQQLIDGFRFSDKGLAVALATHPSAPQGTLERLLDKLPFSGQDLAVAVAQPGVKDNPTFRAFLQSDEAKELADDWGRWVGGMSGPDFAEQFRALASISPRAACQALRSASDAAAQELTTDDLDPLVGDEADGKTREDAIISMHRVRPSTRDGRPLIPLEAYDVDEGPAPDTPEGRRRWLM